MKLLIAFMLFAQLTPAQAVSETTLTLKPNYGTVQVEAVGRPAMVKIKGKGEGPQGSLKIANRNLSGEIRFALDTLDTGIDLRNEHMREKYLETKKYPFAILTLQDLALPEGWSKEKMQIPETKFIGDLLLHGERNPVEGRFEVTETGELKATMELKISDYKIPVPSYLGITVADKVKIQISSKDFF